MDNEVKITDKQRKSFDHLMIVIVISISIIILIPHIAVAEKLAAMFTIYVAIVLVWLAYGAKNYFFGVYIYIKFESVPTISTNEQNIFPCPINPLINI